MSILQDYKNRLKQSYDLCTPHWDRAIDNYKHYLGRLDTGNIQENDYPFASRMSLSVSYEIVETVMPRLIGKDPEFTTVAIEPDDVPYEQTAKMAVDLGYNNPKLELLGEPIYLKLQRGVKEQLITGNAVYRAFWRREKRKQMIYMASLERAGIKDSSNIKKVLEMADSMKAREEIVYSKKLMDCPFLDDFDLKHVPFFFFMPDVAMVDTGKMRYKIERDYVTLEDLQDEAELFGYDKAVMNDITAMCQEKRSGFTPEITKDFLEKYNDMFASLNPASFNTDDQKIPLLIVDKMWMGNRVAVFVNEKYNLTGDLGMFNPYDVMKDPFIFSHDVVIPHSYFSFGEIDAIKKLEDGQNDLLNMRFDNLLQSMLNYWFVNPNMIVDDDEFLPIPNSVTYVKDVDKTARVINGANVTGTVYKEAEELYATIQRITGVNDYVKGNEGETLAGRTYGGLRLVQEMANARFIIKSRLFEKLTLKALGYFILEMSKQFINEDRVRRQFGENGEVVESKVEAGKLKSIKGMLDMKVIPNSSMVIDQQAEAMKLSSLADRFSTNKGPFANIPDEVYDKFLLKFLPLYGVSDAVYWVRAIKESRSKLKSEADKKAKEMVEAQAPPQPMVPAMPQIGMPPANNMPMIQSDQIANQPNPLEQILSQEVM